MTSFATIWENSVTAELSWVRPSGPVGIPVVPLVWAGRPCVALPFCHLALLDTLTDGNAIFSVTDARTLPQGSPAVAAIGRVKVSHDLSGDVFVDALLAQEIRKHPPTRQRADGLLARRENWWWLPRIIVTLLDTVEERILPPRTSADDALLISTRPEGPTIDVVTALDWPHTPGAHITLRSLDNAPLTAKDGDGYVFAHHYSPDFDQWERWYRHGPLRDTTLTVTDASGSPVSRVQPLGLWARLRAHRSLVRACQQGITVAETRAGLR